MIRKIKDIIWKTLAKINLGGPIQLMLNGALLEDGWFKSYNSKKSIDRNGNPIPWCSYPFIKFIEPRLKKEFNIFEYGCGNSTLWYAQKVGCIKSVEHDKIWFDIISKQLPSNARVINRELEIDGQYSSEVLADNEKYQIIIIDGRDRNNCAKKAIDALSDDGIIIFDNSQVPEFKEGCDFIEQSGFKKIDFIGMTPVINHNNTTTIYYRSNNCIGI